MRSSFWSYYPPTDGDFDVLSNEALVVLDASALLHLYRLSPETSEAWLNLLNELRDRLWLPHQAALEYQRNRVSEVARQNSRVANIRTEADAALDALLDKLSNSRKDIDRSRAVEWDEIETAVERARAEFHSHMSPSEARLVDREAADRAEDVIHQRVTELFDGRVGPAPSDEGLSAIFAEGKARYAAQRAPGWKDKDKTPDSRKFGDLVLWKQVLAKASGERIPVVLVTEDVKEDWWRVDSRHTISPDPLLREEFAQEVGRPFWMYTVARFLAFAARFGGSQISAAAVEDATALEEADAAVAAPQDIEQKDRLKAIVTVLEVLRDPNRLKDEAARDEAVALLVAQLQNELTSVE